MKSKMPDSDRQEKIILDLYNDIYERDGFIGIIHTLKESFRNGTVENLNGLYKITVDDLFIDNVMVDALLHSKSFMLKHFKGFICNKVYYFSEEPCDNVEMINITQLEEDREFEERTREALNRVESDSNRRIMNKKEFIKMLEYNIK